MQELGDETYIQVCLPEDYHSGFTKFFHNESVFVCTRIMESRGSEGGLHSKASFCDHIILCIP